MKGSAVSHFFFLFYRQGFTVYLWLPGTQSQGRPVSASRVLDQRRAPPHPALQSPSVLLLLQSALWIPRMEGLEADW